MRPKGCIWNQVEVCWVVATGVCVVSVRVVQQIKRAVVKKFRQLNIGWEGAGIVEDFRLSFPEIKVLPSVQSNDDGFPSPFHLVTKAGVLKLVRGKEVSALSGATCGALWSERLGPGSPSTPLWHNMFVPPIYGFLADIQWRLTHWALPSNTFIHHLNASVPVNCPFCEQEEDLFHAYVQCRRLAPLFSVITHLSYKLFFTFTLHMFIFGVPFNFLL